MVQKKSLKYFIGYNDDDAIRPFFYNESNEEFNYEFANDKSES